MQTREHESRLSALKIPIIMAVCYVVFCSSCQHSENLQTEVVVNDNPSMSSHEATTSSNSTDTYLSSSVAAGLTADNARNVRNMFKNGKYSLKKINNVIYLYEANERISFQVSDAKKFKKQVYDSSTQDGYFSSIYFLSNLGINGPHYVERSNGSRIFSFFKGNNENGLVAIIHEKNRSDEVELVGLVIVRNNSLVSIIQNQPNSSSSSLIYVEHNGSKLHGLARQIDCEKDKCSLVTSGEFTDGNRDGKWLDFFENGTSKSQILYKNGKKFGEEISFFENGSVKARRTYFNDDLHGEWTEFFENGTTKSVSMYKNGLQEGIEKEYFDNGEVKSNTAYRNGKKNGYSIQYFENGKISVRTNYVDDEIDGDFSEFFENGNLMTKNFYKRGLQEGLQLTQNLEGKKVEEQLFRRGKLNGISKYYVDDSVIETNYKDGNQIGPKIMRNMVTGKKELEYSSATKSFHLKSGKEVKLSYDVGTVKTFDSDTGLIMRSTKILGDPILLSDGTIGYIKSITEYIHGKKIQSISNKVCWISLNQEKFIYFSGGKDEVCKLDGIAKKYFPNGNLEYVEQYKQGRSIGEQRYYWPSGKLKIIYSYNENEQLDGISESYHENGKIAERTNFVKGETRGESTLYSASGKILKKGILEPGAKKNESLWVEFIEYYENGRPKKQCDFRSGKCVQWDVTGHRFDVAH